MPRDLFAVVGIAVLAAATALAQSTVTGQVVVENAAGKNQPVKELATVVWLEPIEAPGVSAPPPQLGVRLAQKGKQFEPHVLVIPVGTAVQFPNFDPFFHNVFSLFDGKRFDLGLYEAGSNRTVHFDRPGISYIFCNIHPEMSAVVIAVATPYYALARANGSILIAGVPPGRYRMEVWHEGSSPEALKSLSRVLVVSGPETALGKITVLQDDAMLAHKNKYGRDYDEPARPPYRP